ARYEIDDRGLAVGSVPGATTVHYDLRESAEEMRSTLEGAKLDGVDLEQLAFFAAPVTWELWVEVWDRDQSGGRYPPRLVIGTNLLPVGNPRPAVQPT
ncbi:MAG TPA: hypothetical protein VHB99_08355, partial [Pirellulales bacterium]|nr:hypothetical protein [Pirellulales bacterium]